MKGEIDLEASSHAALARPRSGRVLPDQSGLDQHSAGSIHGRRLPDGTGEYFAKARAVDRS